MTPSPASIIPPMTTPVSFFFMESPYADVACPRALPRGLAGAALDCGTGRELAGSNGLERPVSTAGTVHESGVDARLGRTVGDLMCCCLRVDDVDVGAVPTHELTDLYAEEQPNRR